MTGNCSNEPPHSEVFLQELSVAEKVCVGVCTALCAVVLVLFADRARFFYQHYDNSHRYRAIKQKSMALVGLYPVAAVTSLLAVYIPRSKVFDEFLTDAYMAMCLYQFTSLIILYFGGTTELTEKVQHSSFKLRAPPCCCCCCCCPSIPATKSNLAKLQLMVLQTVFIQPIVSFISVVLWLDGKYNADGSMEVDSVSTYLSTVTGVSTLVAMYGLLVLFRCTRGHLANHRVLPKFLVLQLVLIINGLQKLLLRVLGNAGYPPCRGLLSPSVRADAYHHMLVVAEMCLLAFCARLYYHHPVKHHVTSSDDDIRRKLCEEADVGNGIAGGSKKGARSYNAVDNTNADSFSISE